MFMNLSKYAQNALFFEENDLKKVCISIYLTISVLEKKQKITKHSLLIFDYIIVYLNNDYDSKRTII